ncbi:reverse transcriptase family protein [Alkalicoccobacillus plakortidis]|uniref:Reverse transcriptase family protein n=1 Tax=Alkalicoccobacillus plakortidis TaxID=444060 RepID=A0ABT0XKV4_9BACI|nr:reverse transcriptase family protein [Alkalicoccobacillus plakortidis]MCM2675869.1 reverse transcriptase family protein [Alkalicoccobacillus plakortidis]
MDKKSVGRDRNHYHEARPSRKEKHGRKKSKNVWIRYVLDIFIRNLLSRLLDVVINNVSWFMSKIYDMISNLLYQFLRVVSLKISEAHAFYQLKSKRRLATILGIRDPKFFKHLDKNLMCYRFTIEKAGKTRVILNPSKPYKKILRKINLFLQNIDFPDYLHSGLKKRNALSNARYHDNKPYVCTMDLKNFFPSTSEVYVYKFFKDKLKMSVDVAKIVTMLVTHEDVEEKKDEKKIRRLPQGFPTSSILSYLVYFDLFNGLNRLTQMKNMKFSVYVDDLTFSSNRKITSSFINKVKSIAFRHQANYPP